MSGYRHRSRSVRGLRGSLGCEMQHGPRMGITNNLIQVGSNSIAILLESVP
jgi:hypothetical protein